LFHEDYSPLLSYTLGKWTNYGRKEEKNVKLSLV